MVNAKTIAEKIMSTKAGVDASAGQIVEAEIDYVMANDVTAPIAFREFEALGREPGIRGEVLSPEEFGRLSNLILQNRGI